MDNGNNRMESHRKKGKMTTLNITEIKIDDKKRFERQRLK